MTWNLYQGDEPLMPLKFSNGKTQEDVVQEVLDAVEKGEKIIFIHGVCGTGKSAIALNIAKELGKASVVVPGKALQRQYKKDYEGNKYLKKKDGERLKIRVITGRKNHECVFLKENALENKSVKREINSKLFDIFSFDDKFHERDRKERDKSTDNKNLPCKIEIKEKNLGRIRDYLRKNKDVDSGDFASIEDVRRFSVAGACPYWSPAIPNKYDVKFENKRTYMGLKGIEFAFYQRKPGCGFYSQFNSFIDADVIVFNSLKYKLESAISRKPLTEVEIIDECDEFLDSFSNQRSINIDRLQNSLLYIFNFNEDTERTINKIQEILKSIKRERVEKQDFEEIIPLKDTKIYDLFSLLLGSEVFEEVDEENYIFEVEETARMFEGAMNDSYVTFSKKDDNVVASVITTNLEKKFHEMAENNKVLVLMSGTLHSEKVLKDVFGLRKFKVVDAEVSPQGEIKTIRTGMEINCKYSNIGSRFNREYYLKALEMCVRKAWKPILVHVNSFSDLPSREEIKKFGIKDLISREELLEMQGRDKTGKLVEEFKKRGGVLFTTKCSRGVDFPGEQCNSIIFTKYPNPNIKDVFWRILKKTKPEYYWEFYNDKAKRELWQKVYRGLRSKEDRVFVLSPDVRVIGEFER